MQIKSNLIIISLIVSIFSISLIYMPHPGFGGTYNKFKINHNSIELYDLKSESCSKCHQNKATEKAGGPHNALDCESCHGTNVLHEKYSGTYKNGNLPDSLKLIKPLEKSKCIGCHVDNEGKVAVIHDTSNVILRQMIDLKNNTIETDSIYTDIKCIFCHSPHDPTNIK